MSGAAGSNGAGESGARASATDSLVASDDGDAGGGGDDGDAGSGIVARIPFGDALRVWLKIGLLSFGGPAGQIAMMHRILVEEKKWIGEDRFMHALNYCMLLPGPEAQQLTVYIGWLMHRTKGGVIAGTLFVLPGALVMLLLSMLYVTYKELPLTEALLVGVKAAVVAIVLGAVIKIGKKVVHNKALVGVAVAAFVAIFFLNIPFPLIVAAAAGFGLLMARFRPGLLARKARREAVETDSVAEVPSTRWAVITCLALWLAPVGILLWWLGGAHVFAAEATFFSKLAVVTFGGAYAVLAYMAQQAVEVYGWLAPGEMVDGLGLAETTPGPLIMVVQFVGFLGAYRNPGALDPMLAGTLGAILTTWVTLLPCFVWIFLGAPYIERLRNNKTLSAALSAITAAVLGVVVNLALWFALHVLFGKIATVHAAGLRLFVPEWSSLDLAALALSIFATLALLRWNIGMLPTLALCGIAGIAIGSLAL